MDSCQFPGTSDMYGVGIRVGFYMQWYGKILASWIAKSEARSLRLSGSFFVAATFLALCLQSAKKSLRPVEIYIILLLTFGGYLYLVPLWIWRLATGCTPRWDPARYRRVKSSRIHSKLNFGLLASVSLFQLWFWVAIAGSGTKFECAQYGFFFGRVSLQNTVFVIINVLIQAAALVICLGVLSLPLTRKVGLCMERQGRKSRFVICTRYNASIQAILKPPLNPLSHFRKVALQQMHSLIQLIVTSIVVVATELVIKWNGIRNVNDVSTAGQTIPMVIGIGLFIRVIYVYFAKREDTEGSDDTISTGSISSITSGSAG